MATLAVGGQALTLLPHKAAFLDDLSTLLVADAHIGKAVSFRKWGVPVPRGTTTETLSVLTALVESTGARRIVFLGDFGPQVGVLPAFGSFTGMHPIGRTELDRVFVVAD